MDRLSHKTSDTFWWIGHFQSSFELHLYLLGMASLWLLFCNHPITNLLLQNTSLIWPMLFIILFLLLHFCIMLFDSTETVDSLISKDPHKLLLIHCDSQIALTKRSHSMVSRAFIIFIIVICLSNRECYELYIRNTPAEPKLECICPSNETASTYSNLTQLFVLLMVMVFIWLVLAIFNLRFVHTITYEYNQRGIRTYSYKFEHKYFKQ